MSFLIIEKIDIFLKLFNLLDCLSCEKKRSK